MKAVFINRCHPETPHVCATRLREFARVMAARGHKIILFTETLNRSPKALPVDLIEKQLKNHNFETPFYIAAPSVGHSMLNKLRDGRVLWGIRQIMIYWAFSKHCGLLPNWRKGSQPYLNVIASNFLPDIIWSTFGGTDCWNIAQDLARKSGCNWVADIKDPWQTFVPKPFRRSLASRYFDAVHMTTFSDLHKNAAEEFFPMNKNVLYSGFSSDQLKAETSTKPDEFIISLTGSTYRTEHLITMLGSIAEWLESENAKLQNNIKLVYAGPSTNEVEIALKHIKLPLRIEVNDYLNLDQYFNLLQSCHLNMYIRNSDTFHHKIFELLAVGAPILCFPAESKEVSDIVARVGGTLFSCKTSDDICNSLNSLKETTKPTRVIYEAITNYRWETQAELLEQIISDASSLEQPKY